MAHYLRTSPDFNPARYVKIVNTETVDTYTVYVIELSFGPYRWTVKHRYNEFRDLHDKLVSRHKLERNLLPPKKLFGNNSESFIRKRQGELELYLQTLLYKLKIVPHDLGLFLEFDQYEIHGIMQVLAERLYHRGDMILQAGGPYHVSPLQLHAITNRLKLPEPTCESGDAMKDIGHVLDFITRIKHVKIIGQQKALGASNILMNDLNYDLSMFKALEDLELAFCNPAKICATEGIKKSVKKLRVFNTVSKLKEVLLVDVAFGQWLGSEEEAVLVPVWTSLAAADFSHNNLDVIDESVKLMPKVECVDLSHNALTDICHLENLSSLTHLDLSHNNIHCLDVLHTKLGNIKTLRLAHNKLESLQGFSKLYSLEKLDLSNNEISQVLEVQHVSSLPCLELIKLADNPVTIVLDYRTKVLEFFKDRAKEIALDGIKATQKELDTVAILLALQKSKQAKDKTRKHRKAREATIVDPSSDSSRRRSPTLQHRSFSLPTFDHGHTAAQMAPSPLTGLRDHSSSHGLRGHSPSTDIADPSIHPASVTPSTDERPIMDHSLPSEHHPVPQGSSSEATKIKTAEPRLGYQLHLDWASPESLTPQSGTMLPETLPSRNDSTFMTHLQELLPNTSALSRRSHTRDDRREQQEERTVHVMWCTVLCYTRPFGEIMACICITTENLHMLEVRGLRGDQGMPKLVHIYCIPLVNLQQIILGYQRQYLRVEEAFVGPQGTYALLTGSMAKTDLFIDSLKLAYRRAISDIDQYEDPHIATNEETEKNLLRTLNRMEGLDQMEDISISLYMLVNAIDYSHSTRPFVTHSLVMTSRYLYLLREDYVMWPQATFAIGISMRSQFVVACAFPIMGKITGIQMYDSDTYSPDHDTSLSQTFSATKTCAMVVPNFIGYGVKLTFDMGSQGLQSMDIRVPTSGMRDRFLATLTQLRKNHSERLSSSPRFGRSRIKLKDVDTDSLSTNSGGSNGAKPKYHKHSTPRHKHRHKRYEMRKQERSSGQRPDLLPDFNPVTPWVLNQTSPSPTHEGSGLNEINPPRNLDSSPYIDSNDDTSYLTGLPQREAPIGQSGNSEDSSNSDEAEIPAFMVRTKDDSSNLVAFQSRSEETSFGSGTADKEEVSSDDIITQEHVTPREHVSAEDGSLEDAPRIISDQTSSHCRRSPDYDYPEAPLAQSMPPEGLVIIKSLTEGSQDTDDAKVQHVQSIIPLEPSILTLSCDGNSDSDNREVLLDQCPSPVRPSLFQLPLDLSLDTDTTESLITMRPSVLPLSCDMTLDPNITEPPSLQATPPTRPSILRSELSLDVQYPGMNLLSHLTGCNEHIQLLVPLSDVIRNLCMMEGDELLNYFHGSVAQIGQSTEELRHVLWSPVLIYNKPHKEVVSCVMVSTKAVYFVSDHDPKGQLSKLKEWKSHSRNKSDSYKMLPRDHMDGSSDLHLTAGVVHRCKQVAGQSLKIPRTYAVIPLKDIKQVTVGLFDQSFRLVGPTADLTFTCMTRDNKLTTDFIENLTSVLNMVNPTPSPDIPGAESEQDFYNMFTTYNRLESQEYKHSSKVRFIYPNEDLISELLFIISENDITSKPREEIHLLLYLTVFMKNPPSNGTPDLDCATISEGDQSSHGSDLGKPITLIMSEPYLTICQEDHVHYPIPEFAFGPPAFSRLRILENRHLTHLKRIMTSNLTPHVLTLVFADEKDIEVNPEFDHYSPYGGRVRRHITPVPEVSMAMTIQNLAYKDKFMSLLSKQRAELQTLDNDLEIIVSDKPSIS